MCAKIVIDNCECGHLTSTHPLTNDELKDAVWKEQMTEFNKKVEAKCGAGAKPEDFPLDLGLPVHEAYKDDPGGGMEPLLEQDDIKQDETDQKSAANPHVGNVADLQQGDRKQSAQVIGRKREADGTLRGQANTNHMIDTRTCTVRFRCGAKAEHAANTIATNMRTQCDTEGNQFLLMKETVDHKFDGNAIKLADQFVCVNGRRSKQKTTKGWWSCIQWKGGTTTWEKLKDIKKSNPIKDAEHAIANDIKKEPAFDCKGIRQEQWQQ